MQHVRFSNLGDDLWKENENHQGPLRKHVKSRQEEYRGSAKGMGKESADSEPYDLGQITAQWPPQTWEQLTLPAEPWECPLQKCFLNCSSTKIYSEASSVTHHVNRLKISQAVGKISQVCSSDPRNTSVLPWNHCPPWGFQLQDFETSNLDHTYHLLLV